MYHKSAIVVEQDLHMFLISERNNQYHHSKWKLRSQLPKSIYLGMHDEIFKMLIHGLFPPLHLSYFKCQIFITRNMSQSNLQGLHNSFFRAHPIKSPVWTWPVYSSRTLPENCSTWEQAVPLTKRTTTPKSRKSGQINKKREVKNYHAGISSNAW